MRMTLGRNKLREANLALPVELRITSGHFDEGSLLRAYFSAVGLVDPPARVLIQARLELDRVIEADPFLPSADMFAAAVRTTIEWCRQAEEQSSTAPHTPVQTVQSEQRQHPMPLMPVRSGLFSRMPRGTPVLPARSVASAHGAVEPPAPAQTMRNEESRPTRSAEGHRPVASQPARPLRAFDVERRKSCQWYAQPVTAGTLHGEGAGRLLETDMPTAHLLVREMAQNTWDARLEGRAPEFRVDWRTLDANAIGALRNRVFREGSEYVRGLGEVLRREQLPVIEIHDRGTCGLDGPTRNDFEIPEGEARNYVDLILSMGVPRQDQKGGGTHGFGKTAAVRASSCRTVIYWTRVRSGTGFESRLIALAVSAAFSKDAKNFSGRHWWGWVTEDDFILPLQNEKADALGQRIFSRGFAENETGTSIMVLDPVLTSHTASRAATLTGEDSAELSPSEYMEQVRDAVRLYLWPKRVGSAPERLMDISITLEGKSVEIPPPSEDPAIAPFVECLKAVRASQDRSSGEQRWRGKVLEVRRERPIIDVGRLGMTEVVRLPDEAEDPLAEQVLNRVCYMRSRAELVVGYRRIPGTTSDPAMHWAGVFKPMEAEDHHFADSEPATHDNWSAANTGANKRAGHCVRTWESKVTTLVKEYLKPPEDPSTSAEMHSVAHLNRVLNILMPAPRPAHAAKPRSRARQPVARPRVREAVEVISTMRTRDGDGIAWSFEVSSQRDEPVTVRAIVGVSDADGKIDVEPDPHVLEVIGWDTEADGSTDLDDGQLECTFGRRGASARLEVRAASDVLLALSFEEVSK